MTCDELRALRDAEVAKLPGLDADITAKNAISTAKNALAQAAWLEAMDAMAAATAAVQAKQACEQTINGFNQLMQFQGCNPI